MKKSVMKIRKDDRTEGTLRVTLPKMCMPLE